MEDSKRACPWLSFVMKENKTSITEKMGGDIKMSKMSLQMMKSVAIPMSTLFTQLPPSIHLAWWALPQLQHQVIILIILLLLRHHLNRHNPRHHQHPTLLQSNSNKDSSNKCNNTVNSSSFLSNKSYSISNSLRILSNSTRTLVVRPIMAASSSNSSSSRTTWWCRCRCLTRSMRMKRRVKTVNKVRAVSSARSNNMNQVELLVDIKSPMICAFKTRTNGTRIRWTSSLMRQMKTWSKTCQVRKVALLAVKTLVKRTRTWYSRCCTRGPQVPMCSCPLMITLWRWTRIVRLICRGSRRTWSVDVLGKRRVSVRPEQHEKPRS